MNATNTSSRFFSAVSLFLLGLLPVTHLVSIAAMELVAWLVFIIFILEVFRDLFAKSFKGSHLLTGTEWPLFGFFLVVSISAFLNISDLGTIFEVIGDLRWILLLYAYVYLLRKHWKFAYRKYIGFYSVVVILVGLYSVAQFFTGVEFGRSYSVLKQMSYGYYRSSGFFNLPLTFAANIGMAGFLLFGFALTLVKNKQFRNLYFVALVIATLVAGLGVVVSFTRGAWLATGAALVLTSVLRGRRAAVSTLLVLAVGGCLTYAFSPTLRSHFQSIVDTTNSSNNTRLTIWRANWEMVKDNPISGVGLFQNNKKEKLYEYYEKIGATDMTFVGHAHNNLLQMLVGTGVFGLLFYLWFCFVFLRQSFALMKKSSSVLGTSLGLGSFSAQVYLHLSGMTECNFTDGEVTHMLIFLWALVVVVFGREIKKANLSPVAK